MQQLNLVEMRTQQECIQCIFQDEITFENAVELIPEWLAGHNLKIIECIIGADRISWQLQADKVSWLHFEALSQSVWFEGDIQSIAHFLDHY
ncbi:DUF3630 family protein [Catenovulum sediminis]|uniref:DUF3630 family protein n=1 Tax=Catenovulum sediminis TaxID=1740262 RepID=A0ABV1RHE5_9ALTE|nr:DUF3630 family protein [Catenovulum sediminis]